MILGRDIGNAFPELLLKSLRNKQEKCEEQAVEVKVTRGQKQQEEVHERQIVTAES